MTTLTSGSTVTFTLGDGGFVALTSNGGLASIAITQTTGEVQIISIGPLPDRRKLGPFTEGASIVLTSQTATLDYDYFGGAIGLSLADGVALKALTAGAGSIPWARLVQASTGEPLATSAITPTVTFKNVDAIADTGTRRIPAGTLTAATAASDSWYSSGVFSQIRDPSFYYSSSISGSNTLYYPILSPSSPISFHFSGRYLYIHTYSAQPWQIKFGNKLSTIWTFQVSNVWTVIDFGAYISEDITLLTESDQIGAFATLSEGVITPVKNAVSMVAMSDSIGGFATPNNTLRCGWITEFGYRCGLTTVGNDQQGGTGYLAGTGVNDALFRLGNWMVRPPNMLLTLFGINETWPEVGTTLKDRIYAYYAKARSASKTMLLVSTNGFAPSEQQQLGSTKWSSINSYILGAFAAVGGPWIFIDNINGGWKTSWGTSAVGNRAWQTGDGRAIVFTAPLIAATSATLANPWLTTNLTGKIVFSDGTEKTATLTSNSTAVSWTGPVTATKYAGVYATVAGNSIYFVNQDGTHPTYAPDFIPVGQMSGAEYLQKQLISSFLDAMKTY